MNQPLSEKDLKVLEEDVFAQTGCSGIETIVLSAAVLVLVIEMSGDDRRCF